MTCAFSVSLDELKEAYERTKADRPDRCFIEHPFLFDWARIDYENWLEQVRSRIASGFNPHPCRLCWVPKANSLLRPANILHLKDEVVYNLLVAKLYGVIWGVLQRWQGEPDSAYVLLEPEIGEWFMSQFKAWEAFREVSLRHLAEGARFVVVSDITGFYENIDLGRLLSELRQIAGGSRPEINLLKRCLRKWSSRGDKGIPQGYSASDVLAKLYIHTVDVGLRNDGFKHVRYVDDIRIFCSSRLEAKRAILCLARHIHGKGLNLQSAKTRILNRNTALQKFSGVKPIVEAVQRELIAQIYDEISDGDPYFGAEDVELLLEGRENLPAEVLERTFSEYFAASNPSPFDKTLFHYLLNRLAKAQSRIAVGYCLDALRERPEETTPILNYLGRVPLEDGEHQAIVDFLVSDAAIYDYQSYKIVKWLLENEVRDDHTLSYCRHLAQDYNRDVWLRSYAVAYLGRYGDITDMQLIESLYRSCSSDLERADCIMGLRRLETGKRNAFYAAAAGDGALADRAVRLAKAKG